jgi:glycosyltransferase involved in cell wall biosynthesis
VSRSMSTTKVRPEFTIITVTLNSEKTLQRCINSLKAQNYKNFEYIIIDGVSWDLTLQIIDENQDIIDTLISEADSGLYDAMNKGIAVARGRFVGIINSDDEYLPETLNLVKKHLESNPREQVIYGDLFMGDGMHEILSVPINEISSRMIPHPTVFVSLETYQKHGVFNTSYKVAADYELILRLRNSRINFHRINQPLARMHSGGYSAKHRFRSVIETVRLHIKYREKRLVLTLLREVRFFLASYLNH